MTTYYSDDHEWLTLEGDVATLGVTNYATEQMGSVVFIEMKDAGDSFAKGDEIGVIESVKAASELYAPVDGEIIESNSALEDAPESLNDDPEAAAWIYKIKVTDASQLNELMDLAAYKSHIE